MAQQSAATTNCSTYNATLAKPAGGLQMQTDLAIDPAGNVWVMNNWQDLESCFGFPSETLSTRCGGQGVVIFYGMAKPVIVSPCSTRLRVLHSASALAGQHGCSTLSSFSMV
jgi:hypothetical protein